MIFGGFRRSRRRKRRIKGLSSKLAVAEAAFKELIENLSVQNKSFYDLTKPDNVVKLDAVRITRLLNRRLSYFNELKMFSVFKKIFDVERLKIRVGGFNYEIPTVCLSVKSNSTKFFVVFDVFFRKFLVFQVPSKDGSNFSIVNRIQKDLCVVSRTPESNSVEERLIKKIQSNMGKFEEFPIKSLDMYYVFKLL
jgi:hypothetical protein